MSDRGHWMQLVSGKPFFPLDPRPEDIDINDIAHALSMVCRFGGHVHSFYSVAEHSVRVSDAIRDAGGSLEEEFAGLLHDASEAYLGDVIWPLKVSPELGAYRAVEERVERVIAEAFGMLWPLPKIVKQFDLVLLATEKRDLMLSHANGGVKLEAQASAARLGWHIDKFEPLSEKIETYSNLGAKHLFLSKFMRLSEARLHVNRRPQEVGYGR